MDTKLASRPAVVEHRDDKTRNAVEKPHSEAKEPHDEIKEPHGETEGPRIEIEEPHDEITDMDDLRTTSIFSTLSPLLLSERFSDMTITCGGRTFHAHRAIVCPQANFIGCESATESKEVGAIVDLPDNHPEVVQRFLQFLYTGNYDDGASLNLGQPANIAYLTLDEVAQELDAGTGIKTTDCRLGSPELGYVNNRKNRPELDSKTTSSAPVTNESRESSDPSTMTIDNNEEDDSWSETHDREMDDIDMGELGPEPQEEYQEFDEAKDDDLDNTELDPQMVKLMQGGDIGAKLQELAKIRQDHFLHLRLFVMAEKYYVPALKLLSRERFYRSVELTWEFSDDFPDLVDEMYTNSAKTNGELREIVCRLVGSNLLDARTRERMEPVMKKHGDFAVDVINSHIRSNDHSHW